MVDRGYHSTTFPGAMYNASQWLPQHNIIRSNVQCQLVVTIPQHYQKQCTMLGRGYHSTTLSEVMYNARSWLPQHNIVSSNVQCKAVVNIALSYTTATSGRVVRALALIELCRWCLPVWSGVQSPIWARSQSIQIGRVTLIGVTTFNEDLVYVGPILQGR